MPNSPSRCVLADTWISDTPIVGEFVDSFHTLVDCEGFVPLATFFAAGGPTRVVVDILRSFRSINAIVPQCWSILISLSDRN